MHPTSAFGPLGCDKLILKGGGSVLISKDFRECSTKSSGALSVRSFLQHQLESNAERQGDGLLTGIIMQSSIFDSIISPAGLHSSSIHLMQSASHLLSSVHQMRNEIATIMVDENLWRCETNAHVGLALTSASMLFPSRTTSPQRLTDILNSWGCFAEQQSESTLRERLHYLLTNLPMMIKTTKSKNSSNAGPDKVVPRSQIILPGACKDASSLIHPLLGTKLVFLRSFGVQTDGETPAILSLPTSSGYLTSSEPNAKIIAALEQRCKEMQAIRVIIVCGGKVDDQCASQLACASLGMHVICNVPMDYLQYAAARCGATLYDDACHAVQAGSLAMGQCSHVNRLLLGGMDELHYVLYGVEEPQDAGEEALVLPTQVVLRGTSQLSNNLAVNMLRRCLRAMLHQLGAGSEYIDKDHDQSTPSLSQILVPGAGAAELGWSLLWSQVASGLRRLGDQQAGRPHSMVGQSTAYSQRIAPLVAKLVEAYRARLPSKCLSLLAAGVSVCDILATAYLQIPLQLISSSEGVLDLASIGVTQSRLEGKRERVLMAWKDRYCSGPSVGRVGLVVNADTTSMEICGLGDAFENSVCASYHHFWDGFVARLGDMVTYLRVGGEAGIVRVSGPLRKTEESAPMDEEES